MATYQLAEQRRVQHLKPGQLHLGDPGPGPHRKEQGVDQDCFLKQNTNLHLVAAKGDFAEDAMIVAILPLPRFLLSSIVSCL